MRTPLVLVLLCVTSLRARAGRHTMEPGETLEHVAIAYGCSVDAVLRANRLDTVLVKAGTVVKIPVCNLKTRARTRERITGKSIDDAERARQALAVVDGTTLVAAARDDDGDGDGDRDADRNAPGGKPWNGALRGSERLSSGDGYRIRRPTRAFGAPHVVEHLRDTIAIVRALYPDVHTLAIGDISAEHGGKLANHVSHQTGVDVDVGFYFRRVPDGYPDRFVAANVDLDLEATWALVTAFARTSHLDDGVQMIFLDYDVQARLHAWARKRGTPDDQLAALLQYPRGRDALSGLVRHWPNHADHLHVRFKAGR